MSKPVSVVVADGDCPLCGHAVHIKSNKRGFLYVYCPTPADGGCGQGMQSRADAADRLIAGRFVKKWRKPEYRVAYLGGEPAPAPEPDPDLEPDPIEDPEARQHRELFGE